MNSQVLYAPCYMPLMLDTTTKSNLDLRTSGVHGSNAYDATQFC